jgi:hypothetical protein
MRGSSGTGRLSPRIGSAYGSQGQHEVHQQDSTEPGAVHLCQLAPIGVHGRPVEACILELPRGFGLSEKLTAAGIALVRTVSGPCRASCGLNRCQYYEGAAFYVAKACVVGLHELEPAHAICT